MWRRTLMATALAGALAASAPAQDDQISAALRDRVAQLTERLGSGDEGEATRAEEALVKLGPRILPLLVAEDGAAEALNERLGRVRETLSEQAGSQDFGVTRVTIKGEGIRLSEVLRELQNQTGNRISDLREISGQDATNPALDLDLEDVPFLEALDRVAEQAGLYPEFYTGDGTVGLLARGDMQQEAMYGGRGDAPVQYTGPFRVSMRQIASRHDFATGDRATSVQFRVAWEPRLRPMLMTLDMANVSIGDDRGNTVEPSVNDEAETVVLRPENPIAEVNLNLNAPDREASTLETLKVAATVTAPSANTVLRLDLADSDASVEEGDVSLALRGLQVDGFVWKVNVDLIYEGNPEAFETYRQGLFNNRLWLQRPDGSRFEHNGGFNQLAAGDDSMTFQYLFVDAPGSPSDYQLVLETPGSIEEIPLEFEFQDVPLP